MRLSSSRVGVVAAALTPQACSASPSQDIMGSFFPSWLLRAILGVAAAMPVRWRLVVAGIDRFIPLALLAYAAMAFAVTCLVWRIELANPPVDLMRIGASMVIVVRRR